MDSMCLVSTYQIPIPVPFHSILTDNFTSVSHKYTLLTPDEEKFVPNMTSNDNRMEIRHNWDMLMPRKLQLSFNFKDSIYVC